RTGTSAGRVRPRADEGDRQGLGQARRHRATLEEGRRRTPRQGRTPPRLAEEAVTGAIRSTSRFVEIVMRLRLSRTLGLAALATGGWLRLCGSAALAQVGAEKPGALVKPGGIAGGANLGGGGIVGGRLAAKAPAEGAKAPAGGGMAPAGGG